MDPLQKPRRGQPVPTSEAYFEAVLDAVAWVRRQQRLGQPSRPLLGPEVRIKNTTPEAVERFGILGLGDLVFDPSANLEQFLAEPAIEGVAPAFPDHDGRFAILLEPCPAGAFARAAIAGLTTCKVSVAEGEEWYDRADVLDGEGATEKLRLLPAGAAQVVARESGTGEKWAIVQLGSPPGSPVEKGVLNAEMAAGETAVMRVYRAGADTGNTLTLYPPEWFGGSVASGAKVTARWDRWDRIWEGLGAPCAL